MENANKSSFAPRVIQRSLSKLHVFMFLGIAALSAPTAAGAKLAHRAHHHRHSRATRPAGSYAAYPYSDGLPGGKPDCRYPDGTPFDPDIIGGPNHVGAGGPAVNLGGFAPCGY